MLLADLCDIDEGIGNAWCEATRRGEDAETFLRIIGGEDGLEVVDVCLDLGEEVSFFSRLSRIWRSTQGRKTCIRVLVLYLVAINSGVDEEHFVSSGEDTLDAALLVDSREENVPRPRSPRSQRTQYERDGHSCGGGEHCRTLYTVEASDANGMLHEK